MLKKRETSARPGFQTTRKTDQTRVSEVQNHMKRDNQIT